MRSSLSSLNDRNPNLHWLSRSRFVARRVQRNPKLHRLGSRRLRTDAATYATKDHQPKPAERAKVPKKIIGQKKDKAAASLNKLARPGGGKGRRPRSGGNKPWRAKLNLCRNAIRTCHAALIECSENPAACQKSVALCGTKRIDCER